MAQGFGGGFEWFTPLLGAAAFLALFRYRLGIIPVIAGCGAAGLLYRLALSGVSA